MTEQRRIQKTNESRRKREAEVPQPGVLFEADEVAAIESEMDDILEEDQGVVAAPSERIRERRDIETQSRLSDEEFVNIFRMQGGQ